MPSAPCSHCGSTEGLDHLCAGESLKLIGQVLDGRYQIGDVLGQGGMGMVFRATQTSVQRQVAVKTLHPTLAMAPQFFERFKREAEMASRLRHPNIITIFDFGRAQDGTCYYVMELLEGDSLKGLVKREGPLTLRRAVDLIEQAGRALAHAHEMGAIHRDLKPHNMMVQRLDGRDFVKVLDFGLVKALEQEEHEQLTSTGQVLGTPQYMPPEQAGGEPVDQRSDLYSLAGVLYFCLTGTSPFGANTVRKALQASLTQPVPPVARRRQGAPVPAELDAFFRKALAREKEDRYQSAEEFLAELKSAVSPCTDAELDALPLPVDPSTAREGSGSGPSRAKGTVAGRKSGSGSSASRARAASNVLVDPALQAAGSGASQARGGRSGSAGQAGQPPAFRTAAPARTASRTAVMIATPIVLLALAAGSIIAFGGRGGPKPHDPNAPGPQPVQAVQVVQVDEVPVPPPEPQAQPSSNIAVRFESTPAGAGVYEGDVWLGTTPVELRIERDRPLKLSFRLNGYEEVQRALDPSRFAQELPTVSVTLSREASRNTAPAAGRSPQKRPSDDIPVFD